MITYAELKDRLARSAFRSRFRLGEKDRFYLAEHGWSVIYAQAERIVTERLAEANPRNDGSQTPMRGHVVFIAQHATGCCCRGCLAKWHDIPAGRALTQEEIASIAAVIVDFLKDHAGDLTGFFHTPDLF